MHLRANESAASCARVFKNDTKCCFSRENINSCKRIGNFLCESFQEWHRMLFFKRKYQFLQTNRQFLVQEFSKMAQNAVFQEKTSILANESAISCARVFKNGTECCFSRENINSCKRIGNFLCKSFQKWHKMLFFKRKHQFLQTNRQFLVQELHIGAITLSFAHTRLRCGLM